MIRNWVEAIGDRNPIYVDEDAARAAGHDSIVAPPAMAQVWTMQGLNAERQPDDPLGRMTTILDDAGYTSVVATNCDQTYHRYLKVGEEVTISTTLEDVVGPKKTASARVVLHHPQPVDSRGRRGRRRAGRRDAFPHPEVRPETR